MYLSCFLTLLYGAAALQWITSSHTICTQPESSALWRGTRKVTPLNHDTHKVLLNIAKSVSMQVPHVCIPTTLWEYSFPHRPVLGSELAATSAPPSLPIWIPARRQCWYCFGRFWNLLGVRPLAMALLQFVHTPPRPAFSCLPPREVTPLHHPSSCRELRLAWLS